MFRCKFRFMPLLQLPPPIPPIQRRFSRSSAAFAFAKLSLKAVSSLSQRPASFSKLCNAVMDARCESISSATQSAKPSSLSPIRLLERPSKSRKATCAACLGSRPDAKGWRRLALVFVDQGRESGNGLIFERLGGRRGFLRCGRDIFAIAHTERCDRL